MQNTQHPGNLLIGQTCGASVNSPPSHSVSASLYHVHSLKLWDGEGCCHLSGAENRETKLNTLSALARPYLLMETPQQCAT